jgi:hypothetical protein
VAAGTVGAAIGGTVAGTAGGTVAGTAGGTVASTVAAAEITVGGDPKIGKGVTFYNGTRPGESPTHVKLADIRLEQGGAYGINKPPISAATQRRINNIIAKRLPKLDV